ncbi:MAG: hypothetical protein NC938_05155 [Candidatus Omnitrophica bacterium]|nr:hypothetical protein [Candidatus Omnitrophota bacterium]MCM8791072.1 hypothetical protein [Candidatus Omnitrophota bacterium]
MLSTGRPQEGQFGLGFVFMNEAQVVHTPVSLVASSGLAHEPQRKGYTRFTRLLAITLMAFTGIIIA